MESFKPLHTPVLFIATSLTLGGLIPFYNPALAIRLFGLPERIAVSPAAQSCFTVYSSRATAMGVAIGYFYFHRQYTEVDVILALLGYVAAVDAYVCWREGVLGKSTMRSVAGAFFGGWGLLGLTSRVA